MSLGTCSRNLSGPGMGEETFICDLFTPNFQNFCSISSTQLYVWWRLSLFVVFVVIWVCSVEGKTRLPTNLGLKRKFKTLRIPAWQLSPSRSWVNWVGLLFFQDWQVVFNFWGPEVASLLLPEALKFYAISRSHNTHARALWPKIARYKKLGLIKILNANLMI